MLIKCPECELQVSDKALSCPHCGFPMDKNITKQSAPRKIKRLPNGFGQISKLNNKNLRRPYRAMVCVGKNEFGRPISRLLKPQAYFSSYNEAYSALVEYNRNPYDLDADISVSELYDKWFEEYKQSLSSESSVRTITAAWKKCTPLYNMRAKDVRARHIKGIIDTADCSANIKSRIKSVFNLMLDYAEEHEIVDKNYARTFNLSDSIVQESKNTHRTHISFTNDELNRLWKNINSLPYVDVILIQCYSGWRPQELGLIELDDVDLEQWTFTGGMKTDAGKNRKVPIHPKIRDLVKKNYDTSKLLGSKYLFNCFDSQTHRSNSRLTYDKYHTRFMNVVKELNLNPDHKPHDPRKQFVTMAKKYKVDEYALKYMIGHAINDLTESVYTDREYQFYVDEMKKIEA